METSTITTKEVPLPTLFARVACSLVFGFICYVQLVSVQAQPVLFQPTNLRSFANASATTQPGVMRSRLLIADKITAQDLATTSGEAQLLLNFFDDVRFMVALKQKHRIDAQSYTWAGQVKGHPHATFNMSVTGEATVLDVRVPGGIAYSVRYKGQGLHEVQEISEDAQSGCGTTEAHTIDNASGTAPGPQSLSTETSADTADQIDVLVAYTAEAEAQAGGPSGMQALINQAFAFANTAYANSQVPLTIVKRATVKVNYTPNVEMGVDLIRLRSATDGYMDEVHAIRDAHKADMVCLFRGYSSAGACGIGYLMSPTLVNQNFASSSFSVCANTCVSNQTFAHELAHNMGCHHDRNSAGGSPAYPYSYGWRWRGTDSGTPEYRSVMSYAPGSRVQHFSNPNVSYQGTPTGVVDTADNARTIINTASAVANFRQRQDPTGPVLYCSSEKITINIPFGSDGQHKVDIGNAGSGIANYNVTDSTSWVTVAPASGSASAVASNPHTIYVDSDSFSVGEYNALLTITDPVAANSPRNIPIIINVHEPTFNDDVSQAQPLAGSSGYVTGDNEYATREETDPLYVSGRVGQYSLWYKWVAVSNTPVTFDTAGSSFDTLLAAYTGTPGSFASISQNDNGAAISPRSLISFAPTAGTTYYIRVDSGYGAFGSVRLNWNVTASVRDWAVY